jgi:gliding motility associated protien GldN
MKRILLVIALVCIAVGTTAQPARRRVQQEQKAKSNANNVTIRQQIEFPVAASMPEDVVWRRDVYRELNLTDDANAGLYYPVEPIGSQMNLFTYLFKLIMSGRVHAYEYRLDGNEVFTDSARIKPLQFLDNYHIYYERTGRQIRIDNSDIPSREVKGYYLKESDYYDQGTSTFHRQVIALCPIMYREDDFGDLGSGAETKYPLFWVRYSDIAPYLSKQIIMTSDINNAATMSIDDYFTTNQYKGKIYKTTNMLGRTLAQYCTTDSAMAKEQMKIEKEISDFEANIFGNNQKKDSLDSIANASDTKATKVKKRRSRRSGGNSSPSVRRSRRSSGGSSSGGGARVTVRRQRH